MPTAPTISLLLTVHNKAWLLERVLAGLLDHRSPLSTELVVVFDGCTDDSAAVFDRVIAARTAPDLRIQKLHTADVWETKANNVALHAATGDYALVVQDDVVLTEPHFDRRLLQPLLAFSDCFAVGGNCAHDIVLRHNRPHWTALVGKSPWGSRLSWLPPLSRALHARHRRHHRDLFCVRDSVNRSPLLLDRPRAAQLDFFDEAFAPLEFDDHDLCLRARRDFGWRCGAYLVDFLSESAWGQLRRSSTSAEVGRQARARNAPLLVDRHRTALTTPKSPENRPLPAVA